MASLDPPVGTTRLSSVLRICAPLFSRKSFLSPSCWRRFSSFYAGDDGQSSTYRMSLLCRRPPTIGFEQRLFNSVNLIGSVVRDVRACYPRVGTFGVFTQLELKSSADSQKGFRILLFMWDNLAKVALTYLKRNDLIHVSGQLHQYQKVDDNGKLRTVYKVTVNEWNYVYCKEKYQAFHTPQNIVSNQASTTAPYEQKGGVSTSSTYVDPEVKRLRLWQIFFASPYEWWDNRRKKIAHRAPDFRHKSTKESLWIHPDDPPWIKRQLELLDDKMAGLRTHERSRPSLGKFEI